MTRKEQRINDVIVKLISKKTRIFEAVRLLGLSKRQVLRIKKKYLINGVASIPHKNRGKTTGKGYPLDIKKMIIKLYQEDYSEWNFHHFNDELKEEHDISVSDSFIYKLLISNGIKPPITYKQSKKSHPPRDRRINAGELIQCDASKHQWLFGDDTYYYLHGAIDDATGIVTGCYFDFQETIHGYQKIILQTILKYGIPECLYTDFRTIFQSTKYELSLEEEISGKQIENTKFAKMLKLLGTNIISTRNPRAKGRIERLWRTFQDRLYKELKKNNIHTINEANEYLKLFIPKYNARFASVINDNKNVFIKVDKNFDYNCQLAVWEEKSVYHHCYLKIKSKYYVIIDGEESAYINTKDKVKVYTFLDTSVNVLYKDKFYKTKIVDIEFKKREYIKSTKTIEEINVSKAHKPSVNHPWRNSFFSAKI